MLKPLLLAVALVLSGPAYSTDLPKGADLDAIIKKHCKNGCAVFNQEQVQALEKAIEAALARAEQEGLSKGKDAAREEDKWVCSRNI